MTDSRVVPIPLFAREDPGEACVEIVEGSTKLVMAMPLLSVKTVGIPTTMSPAEAVDVARAGAFETGLAGRTKGGGIVGDPAGTVGRIHPIPLAPTTIVVLCPWNWVVTVEGAVSFVY